MPKLLLAIIFAAALPACAQEVISERSSLAGKLSQFDRSGWEVVSNEQRAQRQANANARVVRGTNWDTMQFDTNFQVDDPKLRAQLEQRRQQRLLDQQNQQNRQSPPATQPASQPPATQGAPGLFGPYLPGQ
jgi:hypothetical protein